MPEACLALSSLSYYTPLMSLIFSPRVSGLRPTILTKACRESTSGTQGTGVVSQVSHSTKAIAAEMTLIKGGLRLTAD